MEATLSALRVVRRVTPLALLKEKTLTVFQSANFQSQIKNILPLVVLHAS